MEQTNLKIAAHIPLEGFCNARHLGGYKTADGYLTKAEAYIRCEGPEKITVKDMDWLYRFGIRTVIDLRSPEEALKTPNPMAKDGRFVFQNIPVFQTDASPDALTKSGIPMGELYIYMLDYCKTAFHQIFSVILDAQGGVLFHCSAGKDRTGVLAALLLLLAGVDEETVVQEYTYTQTLLAPVIERLKQHVPEGMSLQYAEDMLSARPAYIKAAITHLNDVYHSAKGYLSALGFSEKQTEAIRQRLAGTELEAEKGA